MKKIQTITTTGALVLAAAGAVYAQDNPASAVDATAAPETAQTAAGTVKSWLDAKLPDAISQGKFLLDVRARYEYADQENLRESHAPTVRTRFGYQTAPLYGFTGLLEFENVSILGNENNFNQAGMSGPGRTVVADPETTEVNQAWIAYEKFNTVAKYGRQRIQLDNDRFIGNVGWRQNEQTYDAVLAQNKSLPDTTLTYAYIFNVNRVFGDDHPAGDWNASSHVIHGTYSGFSLGTITPYAYLLDIDDAPAVSTDSFGLNFTGAYTFENGPKSKITYHAEYARQIDAGANPVNFETDYYNIELGGICGRYNAGAGYEVLGSDNGVGFTTPLATLHAFNGWADVFLATPGNGLRDAYGWVGVTLPCNVPLKIVYHDFESDSGSVDYGNEWDAIVSRKFGKHWSALAKYARYDGKPPYYDVDKFWMQLEFKY
ncbi:MAG: alginate export family protein [Verrucomicrobia bacterium]|nr:alginate export family protein [Verrucomicrobiota bacterium]